MNTQQHISYLNDVIRLGEFSSNMNIKLSYHYISYLIHQNIFSSEFRVLLISISFYFQAKYNPILQFCTGNYEWREVVWGFILSQYNHLPCPMGPIIIPGVPEEIITDGCMQYAHCWTGGHTIGWCCYFPRGEEVCRKYITLKFQLQRMLVFTSFKFDPH